jgi:hypothetical protein
MGLSYFCRACEVYGRANDLTCWCCGTAEATVAQYPKFSGCASSLYLPATMSRR